MSLLGFGSPFVDIFMAMRMDGKFSEPKNNFGEYETPDIWDGDELNNPYFDDYSKDNNY